MHLTCIHTNTEAVHIPSHGFRASSMIGFPYHLNPFNQSPFSVDVYTINKILIFYLVEDCRLLSASFFWSVPKKKTIPNSRLNKVNDMRIESFDYGSTFFFFFFCFQGQMQHITSAMALLTFNDLMRQNMRYKKNNYNGKRYKICESKY